MKEEKMYKLVSKLNNKELHLLKKCIEHEILMSERAIEEGFERVGK